MAIEFTKSRAVTLKYRLIDYDLKILRKTRDLLFPSVVLVDESLMCDLWHGNHVCRRAWVTFMMMTAVSTDVQNIRLMHETVNGEISITVNTEPVYCQQNSFSFWNLSREGLSFPRRHQNVNVSVHVEKLTDSENGICLNCGSSYEVRNRRWQTTANCETYHLMYSFYHSRVLGVYQIKNVSEFVIHNYMDVVPRVDEETSPPEFGGGDANVNCSPQMLSYKYKKERSMA